MAKRSAVESGPVRSGTRNVAWTRSKGSIGSTPCTMKKGECPVDLRVVARSAQKAKGATVGHRVSSPSHALKMELRIVRCCRSTMLFAWELYADTRMWRMPKLSVGQSSAARCAIVSDDLLYCSPPAEDLLEYEQAD